MKILSSFWVALVALVSAKDKKQDMARRLTWEYTEFDSEVNRENT